MSATARRPVVDSESALGFLAQASGVLAGSLDYERTLTEVARLAVPDLADWCAVYIVEPDGGLRQITSIHPDPDQESLLMELRRRYRAREGRQRGGRLRGGDRRAASRLERHRPVRDRDPRGGARDLRPARPEVVHDRAAARARPGHRGADDALHARGAPLRASATSSSPRPRPPLRARDRQRAPLRRGRALTRDARHAVPLGADRARLPRPRPRVRAGERRPRRAVGTVRRDCTGRSVAELVDSGGRAVARSAYSSRASRCSTTTSSATGADLLMSISPVRASDGEVPGLGLVTCRRDRAARAARADARPLAPTSWPRRARRSTSSLDYADTLANVTRIAVPEIADWCGVPHGRRDGVLELVAAAHVDPAKAQFAGRSSGASRSPARRRPGPRGHHARRSASGTRRYRTRCSRRASRPGATRARCAGSGCARS